MVVKHDDLGIGPVEVMAADFAADVVGDGDAALLAGDMMNPVDSGRIAVSVAVADDEMFFVEWFCEIEAAAQEVLAGDGIAKGRALGRGAAFDGVPDLLDLRFVDAAEIDGILLHARENHGLYELPLGAHRAALLGCPWQRLNFFPLPQGQGAP